MKRIWHFVLPAILSLVFSSVLHSQSRIEVPFIYGTIQLAIDMAEIGDTILVSTGTYPENIDFKGKDIIVMSEFLYTKDSLYNRGTIIDGTNSGPTVSFTGGETNNAKLIGFKIINGNGSGIYCLNSSPTIGLNIITQNTAANGGGIFCENSSPLIINNQINANSVTSGSQYGGSAVGGVNAFPYIISSTIANNYDPDERAAISSYGGWTDVINSILYDNTTNYEIADSTYVQYCLVDEALPDWAGINNIYGDPDFSHLSTFKLSNTSPCVNAGTPDTSGLSLFPIDLYGRDRIQGDRIDIGAIESPFVFVISFPDVNLEAKICEALSCTPAELTPAKLLELSILNANSSNISDLSGLEYCTNLIWLGLNDNNLTNISQIGQLLTIDTLYLANNNIHDIIPIKNLSLISGLDISYNNVRDLQPLVDNTGFSHGNPIWVSGNPISNKSIVIDIPLIESIGAHVYGAPSARQLFISNPIPDELVEQNTLYDINWYQEAGVGGGALTFRIQLSYDNGGSWITDSTANSGTYHWSVPNIESDQCMLKVADREVPDLIFDILSFRIGGSGSLVVFPDKSLEQAICENLICSPGELTQTKLLELDELIANEKDPKISDLTGLEYCTNLGQLQVAGNNISDLAPLSGLPNLSGLVLFNNSITDLTPLQTVTSLHHLNLVDNLITDISPLSSLTNLKELYLGGNNVSDFSPIYSHSLDILELNDCNLSDISFMYNISNSLTRLELAGNQISDLVPLQDMFFMEYLDISNNPLAEDDLGVVAVQMVSLKSLILDGIPMASLASIGGIPTLEELSCQNCDITDMSPLLDLTNLTYVNLISNPLSSESLNNYIPTLEGRGVTIEYDPGSSSGLFNDPNLEQAVANTLGYAPHELNATRLLELTELYAQYHGIYDLTGLELCTNLEMLYLDGNSISDLSQLQGLTKINYLSLSENQISDVTQLQNLTGLQQLIINRNQISELSILSGLNQLEVLEISQNSITDLTGINAMSNLTHLAIGQNATEDYSIIGSMTQLTWLSISRSNLTDITFLQNLTSLEFLDLDFNMISDLSPLTGMNQLASLYLGRNRTYLTDISPLSGLTSLTDLDLFNNRIADLAPLSELPVLAFLNLSSNQLTSLNGIQGINSLTNLDIGRNQLEDLSGVTNLPNLESLIATRNNITDVSSLQNLPALTQLDLNQNQLTSLDGLENLVTLTSLNLSSNEISDITPLSNLTNLTQLYLESNPLSNLTPLANCNGMQYIWLNSCDFESLNGLQNMSVLEGLYANINNISDISALEGFTGLYNIELNENNISDVSALLNNTSLGDGNSILLYDNPLTAQAENDLATLTGRGVYVEYSIREFVEIPDPGLRKAMAEQLKCGEDELSKYKLEKLTTLRAISDPPIMDLTGIENCINIRWLNFRGNEFRDISPLAGLTNLTSFTIRTNPEIINISSLSELSQLQVITLIQCNLTDISDLSTLTQITRLNLTSNQITDISPVLNLSNLTNLVISDNPVQNLDVLTGLDSLTILIMNNMQLNNIEFVSDLTKLQRLTISNNKITDLSPVQNLPNLFQLTIAGNPFSDLNQINDLANLTTLNINSTQVKDLSPLLQFPSLPSLRIVMRSVPLSNKTIYFDIPELKALGITFTVDSAYTPHDIRFLIPQEGSTFRTGRDQEIRWEDYGGSGGGAQWISLDYSTDGGNTWISVTDSTLNDSMYLWNVPNLGVSEILLRIRDIEVPDLVNNEVGPVKICNIDAGYDKSLSGIQLTLTNTSAGTISDYYWDFGDGTFSSEEDPSHTYDYAGEYTVCLSVYNQSLQCADDYCETIIAGSLDCNAEFSFSLDTATKTVTFSDQSTGYISQWYWNFGNGNWSDLKDPAHTYQKAGTYEIQLSTYHPGQGCRSTESAIIQIPDIPERIPPVADYSFFVDSENLKLVLINNSTGSITDWHWTFGDGNFYNGQQTEHTYGVAGIYSVCLFVSDEVSGVNSKLCKEIQVGTIPCILRAGYDYFVDNATNTLTLTNKTTGGAASYFWNFGDQTTSTSENPEHTYSSPGYYLVSLSVSGEESSCTDFISEFIQIGTAECKADFDFAVDMSKRKVTFNNKSLGDVANHYWDFGDNQSTSLENPVHTYNQPGMYPVTLTVSDANGLCSDQLIREIQIEQVECNADFTVFIDSLSQTIYCNHTGIGQYTDLLWEFGDGYISTEPNAIHTFSEPGYYSIELTTFNSDNNCMDQHEEVVLIASQGIDCFANFIYQVDDPSRTVSFFNKSEGNDLNYIWDFGDLDTSTNENPVHTYNWGSYYIVCLTALAPPTPTDTIQDTRCEYIRVATLEASNCLADFYYVVDSASRTTTFHDISIGSINYWAWDFGDDSTSTVQHPIHTYDEPDYYQVHLQVRKTDNGCENDYYDLVNAGMEGGLLALFTYRGDIPTKKSDGYPVDFIGVASGDAARFIWNFGDGSTNKTTLRPTHYYSNPGIYHVCLYIEDPVTGENNTYCQDINTEDASYVGMPELPVSTGPQRQVSLTSYPNPFSEHVQIVYDLPEKTNVELAVFDLSGSKRSILINTTKDPGQHIITWDGQDLPSGIYLLVIRTENEQITKKLTIGR